MTQKQLAFQKATAFEVWMRETVKTVYYADNLKMAEAYDRIINNHLEIKAHDSIKRKRG